MNPNELLWMSLEKPMSAFLVLFVLVAIVLAFPALCFHRIAQKSGTPAGWLAWVPFANLYLLCKLARTSSWWVLWCCAPVVGGIFGLILLSRVPKCLGITGKSRFWILAPLVNFAYLGYLAFRREPQGTSSTWMPAISCAMVTLLLLPSMAFAATRHIAQPHQQILVEAHWRQTLTNHPDDFMALLNMGRAFAARGELTAAASFYRKAATLNPDRWEPHLELGGLAAQEGRMEEAIYEVRAALAIRKDVAVIHYDLGDLLARKSEYTNSDSDTLRQEAISEFKAALAIDPGLKAAQRNLAILESKIQSRTTMPNTAQEP